MLDDQGRAVSDPHPSAVHPAQATRRERSSLSIDAVLDGTLATVRARAQAHEHDGCGALWVGELSHDPFLQVLEASRDTGRMMIGTGIAVAFARNPMSTAYAAWDLQQYLAGRFILGLGTQVRPHIERRFGMPWSAPARRLGEYVTAIREIWRSWQTGSRLQFVGDFYSHTLMTPVFVPEASQLPLPPIYLAAVGPKMCETAGSVADGFIAHPFSTPRFLTEVTLPAIARGAALAGRSLEDVRICAKSFVAVGETDDEVGLACQRVRRQIAFYASTPAYRPVLDLHGWGDLQPTLSTLSRQGRWDEMGELIDADMLQAFAVAGNPKEVAAEVRRRFEGVADSLIVLGAGAYLGQLIGAAHR
jgi:probable F420-dependent oxidoreductase